MAEFTRPKVKTFLNGLYSFIECFNPDYGNQTRLATYGNQWYYDSSNSWKEVTSMTFTHDATADENLRRDVEGGLYIGKNAFFLKSGGFFNKYTPAYTSFTREANKIHPKVDFAALPWSPYQHKSPLIIIILSNESDELGSFYQKLSVSNSWFSDYIVLLSIIFCVPF